MEPWLQMLISVVAAALASSGLWAFIMKKAEKKDAKTQLLVGLAHDRILSLGKTYIHRGTITPDEYENLHDYLYVPYEKLGGNGSAKQVMRKVELLEMRVHGDNDENSES